MRFKNTSHSETSRAVNKGHGQNRPPVIAILGQLLSSPSTMITANKKQHHRIKL